jgi:hypothetical protein
MMVIANEKSGLKNCPLFLDHVTPCRMIRQYTFPEHFSGGKGNPAVNPECAGKTIHEFIATHGESPSGKSP